MKRSLGGDNAAKLAIRQLFAGSARSPSASGWGRACVAARWRAYQLWLYEGVAVTKPSSTAEHPADKPRAKLGLPCGIFNFAAKPTLYGLFMAWVALYATGAAMAQSGPGSVQLAGSATSLELDAHDSTIAAVLTAMGPAFHVQYHSEAPLNDAITGTYSGPLRPVIAEILRGYDYLIKDEGAGVEIAVFGRSSGQAVPSTLSPAPVAAPVPSALNPARPAPARARCRPSAGHRAAC